jgi:hypothetical protein
MMRKDMAADLCKYEDMDIHITLQIQRHGHSYHAAKKVAEPKIIMYKAVSGLLAN